MRDKHALSFGATPAHQPERPSEPRPSGVPPEEGEVKKDGVAAPLRFSVATDEYPTGLRCTQTAEERGLNLD